MTAGLPVVSFLCSVFLVGLIPLQLKRISVPNLSIISWLLACNIIHSANTIIWAGNVDIHAPAWCDISTKILLGSNMAIPAACLCILSHFAHISSNRQIRSNARANRINLMKEVCICLILPLLYMALHSIVQDRRFEIIEDFGCEAAIFPAVSSILLIWFLPLLLCSIALLFSGIAFYHAAIHHSSSTFTEHLKSRSHLTAGYLVRHSAACIIAISLLAGVFIFSVIATVSLGILPWTTFAGMRSTFNDIPVIPSKALDVLDLERVRIQWTWWTTPVLSVIYILLFGTSEDALNKYRVIGKWFKMKVLRQSDLKTLVLPTKATRKMPPMISTSHPGTPIDLRSGWDDTFDFKHSKIKSKAKAAASAHILPTTSEDDASFKASTLTYLESPVAQTLGLPGPSLPSQILLSERQNNLGTPRSQDDGNSLLRASWPTPPSAIPRSSSPSSLSDSHEFGYPLSTTISPPHFNAGPFQDNAAGVRQAKRLSSRSFSSLRIQSRPPSRDKSPWDAPGDVIYMTPVKER